MSIDDLYLNTNKKVFITKGSFGHIYYKNNRALKYCNIFSDDRLLDSTIRECTYYSITKEANIYTDNYKIVFDMPIYYKELSYIKDINLAIKFAHSILIQLYKLHKQGMTHGDLKPSNVMIVDNNVKLIDFGSVCFFHPVKFKNGDNISSHKSIKQHYPRCTYKYCSPEELISEYYSPSNDIWSFGILCFEMLTGKSFIDSLLLFIGFSTDDINKFNQQQTTNTPTVIKQFLAQIYQLLSYHILYQFLLKYIHHKGFLKLIQYCLIKDYNIRSTIEILLINDLFISLQKPSTKVSLNHYPFINNSIYKLVPFNSLCPKISLLDRNHLIHKLYTIAISNFKYFGQDIVLHSILIFDKLLLYIQDIILPDLLITFALSISSAILRFIPIKISLIKELSNINDTTFIKDKFIEFLYILDFKAFYYSPDIIFSIINYTLDSNKKFNLDHILTLIETNILLEETSFYLLS